MSLWWGLAAVAFVLFLEIRWWTQRQAQIAEIQYFMTALLPAIQSEAGSMGHLAVSFRDASMSMEYNTEDGITLLAGVRRNRSSFEVGACSIDRNELWNFSSTAPVQAMSAHGLKRLLQDCRQHERQRASAFLV